MCSFFLVFNIQCFRNFPKHSQSSFCSISLYSKPILMILDVLKSLDVPLSDSVMTETCSRQTTACSRQTCSSSDQHVRINLLYLFYVKSVNSQQILIVLDVLESLEVIVFDSVAVEACSRQITGCSSSDPHILDNTRRAWVAPLGTVVQKSKKVCPAHVSLE